VRVKGPPTLGGPSCVAKASSRLCAAKSGKKRKQRGKCGTTKTCNIADRSPTVLPDRRTYADGRRRSPHSRYHGHVSVVGSAAPLPRARRFSKGACPPSASAHGRGGASLSSAPCTDDAMFVSKKRKKRARRGSRLRRRDLSYARRSVPRNPTAVANRPRTALTT